MVPQRLLVVGILAHLRVLVLHQTDNGLGGLLPLCLRGQRHGVIHHLLYLTSVFRHDELFALRVVV